jgi:hypothetical protein
MRWIVAVLAVIELAAIAVALGLGPAPSHVNEAALIVAINSIILLLAIKRLRKKKACCS